MNMMKSKMFMTEILETAKQLLTGLFTRLRLKRYAREAEAWRVNRLLSKY